MENLPVLAQSAVKIMILIGLAMYSLFAAILVRQEQLMDKVIDETFTPVLHALVMLHFIASIAVLILSFIIL